MLTSALIPFINSGLGALSNSDANRLKVSIFSKHLQFLNYKEMADAAAEMGFDGVDLTVRPQGHVEPERVEDDLPSAVAALRKAGLTPVVMTTAIRDADDPVDKKVLQTAAKQGFTHYRMNWYPYPENMGMPEALLLYREKLKKLSELNRELKLTGAYQNHAGTQVGSSLWELWEILKDAVPANMGVQYDIRHAMVEGFTSWENGLRLIAPKIRMLTVKDFKWGQENNKWVVDDTPMGEGMIDFNHYFKLLKQYKIEVPVSLHIEYALGGAENGSTKITIDKKEVFKAMKKDLQKLHELWERA